MDWKYLTLPSGTRIRWFRDPAEHAHLSAAFIIEREIRGEWRRVESWNSREWFVAGILAAEDAA